MLAWMWRWLTGLESNSNKTEQRHCVIRIELNLMTVRSFLSYGFGKLLAS
jgi:hypothetical protein